MTEEFLLPLDSRQDDTGKAKKKKKFIVCLPDCCLPTEFYYTGQSGHIHHQAQSTLVQLKSLCSQGKLFYMSLNKVLGGF